MRVIVGLGSSNFPPRKKQTNKTPHPESQLNVEQGQVTHPLLCCSSLDDWMVLAQQLYARDSTLWGELRQFK